MREARHLVGIVLLASGAIWAAPETQTFPVTVSNAVSGKLETVPVTFRFGATNALVERFDGARFVPVPVAERDDALADAVRPDFNRVALIRRLQSLPLPAITSGTISLSNAVELIAGHIRRADTTGLPPVRLLYRCRKGQTDDPYLLPLDIPATNAFEALWHLGRLNGFPLSALKGGATSASRRSEQNAVDPFAPSAADRAVGAYSGIIVFIRDGCVVVKLFGDEDWYCSVMRRYEVPPSFFKRFAKEYDFTRFASEQLGLVDQLSCNFLRGIGALMVTFCGTPQFGFDEFDQLALFEEEVLAPLVSEYSVPQHLRLDLVDDGKSRTLLARAARNNTFLGVWRYEAETGSGGVRRDGFVPCPLDLGMVDDDRLELVHVSVPGRRSGWLGNPSPEASYWALTSHDGAAFRFEGGRFHRVASEPDPGAVVAADAAAPEPDSAALFKGVTVPEFTVRNEHLSNGLAQIQAAIDASPAPTNRLKIVFNPVGAPETVTNVPALSARSISIYDALKLLADVSGLYRICSDQTRTAELLSHSSYTQRLSRCRAYLLPRRLCERMPAKTCWDELLADELQGVVVDAYSPEQRTLVLRSAYGQDGLAVADRAVEQALVAFPGRFTLENKEVNGKGELLLTDTYRDIVRRYRSGIGKDGKRWERFEIVK